MKLYNTFDELCFCIFISYIQKVMPLKAAMTYFTKIIRESELSKMIFVKTVHRQSPVNLLATIFFQKCGNSRDVAILTKSTKNLTIERENCEFLSKNDKSLRNGGCYGKDNYMR